jgi:hypothetical protein
MRTEYELWTKPSDGDDHGDMPVTAEAARGRLHGLLIGREVTS